MRISDDKVAFSASWRCSTNLRIRAPHLELDLHDTERLLAVAEHLRQDLLPLARSEFDGERVLDLSEGPQAHGSVLGEGLLLFGRPDFDLPLERAAGEERGEQVGADAPDRVVVILQHEQVARDRAHTGGQGDLRQARRLGFPNPIERHRDAPLGGHDVGAPLQQFGGQPHRHFTGESG